MRKADAIELAPLRIGTINPRTLLFEGFVFDLVLAHPGGGALERRPWAIKREVCRADFARHSFLDRLGSLVVVLPAPFQLCGVKGTFLLCYQVTLQLCGDTIHRALDPL